MAANKEPTQATTIRLPASKMDLVRADARRLGQTLRVYIERAVEAMLARRGGKP